jgi:hypothetical protein
MIMPDAGNARAVIIPRKVDDLFQNPMIAMCPASNRVRVH